MLLALAFSITDAHSFNNKKTIPQDSFSAYHGAKLPELEYYENYEELRSTSNTVVIYPIFTQSAYELGGIHSFYTRSCETCITVEIQDFYEKLYASSGNGFRILEFLGYTTIDDIDVDKNPES